MEKIKLPITILIKRVSVFGREYVFDPPVEVKEGQKISIGDLKISIDDLIVEFEGVST